MDIETITQLPVEVQKIDCSTCPHWQRGQDPRPELNGTGHCFRFPTPVHKFGNGRCGEHPRLARSVFDDALWQAALARLAEIGCELDAKIVAAFVAAGKRKG